MIPESLPVNPGDWRDDAKKNITNDKEVIINGVCVMNQSSDYKSDDGDDAERSHEDGEESNARLAIAEGNEDDEIKKSFIRKPSMDKSSIENSDDIKVKTEIDESGAWEY